MKRSTQCMGLGLFVTVVLTGASFLAQQPVQQCAAYNPFGPDLIIQEIFLVKYTSNGDCYVAVKVKNRGPGRVPDFVWTDHNPKSAGVYLYRNGIGWGGAAIWQFDPERHLQKPGGMSIFESKLKVSGSATVKAVVDLWETVLETRDNNNSRTKAFKEGDCDSTTSLTDLR